MTKEEKQKYIGAKPIAVCPLYAFGGVEVLDIWGEYIVSRFNDKIHCGRLHFDNNGFYFNVSSMRIRLNDCIRTDGNPWN